MQEIPRRRKLRKTTERVADLEQKINALTALLAAKEADSTTSPDADSTPARPSDQVPESPEETSLVEQACSRGLLDWETAKNSYRRFQREMSHYFPFVVFPESTDPAALKEQQPILFFAIVLVGLNTSRGTPNNELCEMMTNEFASRIIGRGERSLELIQALIVHSTFYTRPKEVRELNFNQMIHIACTMALDIGLGRRPHKSSQAQRTELYQLESLAARRAWLGCYYAATR
jgi:hypothetical protein